MQIPGLGKLEVHRGDVRYEVALRPGALVIGRDPRLGLCLNDVAVSRRHAVVIASAQGVLLHDLGGRNGVTRNGVKVASRGQVALERGDRLRIGETELVFAGEPTAPAPLPAAPGKPARSLVAPRRVARPVSRPLASPAAPAAPGAPRPAPWWAAPAIGAVAVCALLLALVAAGLALVAVVLLVSRPATSGATSAGLAPAPAPSVEAVPAVAAAESAGLAALPVGGPRVAPDASLAVSLAPTTSSLASLETTHVSPTGDVAAAPASEVASAPSAPAPGPGPAPESTAPTPDPPVTPTPPAREGAPLEGAPLEQLVQRLLGRAPAAEDAAALRQADAATRRRWFLAQEALVSRAWAAEVEHQGLPAPDGNDPLLAAARAQDPLTALGALVSGRDWARRHLGAQATARAVFERLLSGPGRPWAIGPDWWAAVCACEGEEAELLGGEARSARELLRLALSRPEARQALQARLAARALGRTPSPAELDGLAAAIEREQAWFGPLVDLAVAAAVGQTAVRAGSGS